MIATGVGESQARILHELKRSGSGTIPDLAERLDLSVETVRTHLKGLRAKDLVERRGERRSGPGRPEIVYGLTASADSLFPTRQGELLRELARYLEDEGHGDLVGSFLKARMERRLEAARGRLDGLQGDDRLEAVAEILSEEGFMAQVGEDEETGETILRLCNCPVRDLVAVTKAPCAAEMGFVRELLGGRLRRISYIPSGDAACTYAVRSER